MDRRAIAALVLSLGLTACADQGPPVTASSASTTAEAGGAPAQLTVIAQGTALPAGYKVDTGRTMVFGTDERWTGRLTYTAAGTADEVFDFLHREMPNFGWIETSAMRSDNSLLTFTSASTGRIATINIRRSSGMGATQVDMVVSPQSGN